MEQEKILHINTGFLVKLFNKHRDFISNLHLTIYRILYSSKGANRSSSPSEILINQPCIKWGISEPFTKGSKPYKIKGSERYNITKKQGFT